MRKYLIAGLFILAGTWARADSNLDQLVQDSTSTSTDLFYKLNSPGSGDIDRSISFLDLKGQILTNTGVAGTYTNLNATIGADGRITAAANGSAGGGGGTTIWSKLNGSALDNAVSTVNVTSPLTATSSPSGQINIGLGTSGVVAGTYGSATQVSTFTVGADGRVTQAGNTAISLTNSNLQSGTYSNVTVPAANVADGTLGSGVAVQDGSLSTVSSSKLSGALPAISGASLTSLTAANISAGTLGASVIAQNVAAGTIGVSQLSFSGTANSSTFARGDGTWATPAGSVTGSTNSVSSTFDGGGSTLVVASSAMAIVPYACTISSWTMASLSTGSVVVGIRRATAAAPTVFTSIIGGGNAPTITVASYGTAAPSGWTSVALAAGDILEFSITSVTAITWNVCSLTVYRN